MLYIVTGNEGIPVVIMRVSIKVFYQLTWTTPMTCHKYNRYIYFILYNVIYLKGVCSLHFCNKTIIKTLDTKKGYIR